MGSRDNAISYGSALVLSLLLLLLHEAEGCDKFTGRWVKDDSYPLYDPSTCPFIRREFGCKKNGRPDLDYSTFRWQPLSCKLARYHPLFINFIFYLFNIFFVSRTLDIENQVIVIDINFLFLLLILGFFLNLFVGFYLLKYDITLAL